MGHIMDHQQILQVFLIPYFFIWEYDQQYQEQSIYLFYFFLFHEQIRNILFILFDLIVHWITKLPNETST